MRRPYIKPYFFQHQTRKAASLTCYVYISHMCVILIIDRCICTVFAWPFCCFNEEIKVSSACGWVLIGQNKTTLKQGKTWTNRQWCEVVFLWFVDLHVFVSVNMFGTNTSRSECIELNFVVPCLLASKVRWHHMKLNNGSFDRQITLQ